MNRRHCLFLQASQFGSPRTCYVPGRMKVRWAFDPPVLRAIRVFTKEIRSFNPKGNQSWILIGRNDAEPPVLWSPDVKSRFIGKHLDAGKDWRQEEKGVAEDEIVGWHYWLKGQWVWANSGRYWRTGKPGMLQFMELHSIRHDLMIEQRHIYAFIFILYINCHLALLDKN